MTTERDATVSTLEELFATHPAWLRAARHVEEGASSRVLFSHRPGERWHLVREGGRTRLRPGDAEDPDFAFRFTPAAVERLAAVSGGVGDFAVELFDLMSARDETVRVGFRVVASFSRLVRRGYLGVLAAGGLRVLAYGAKRGVRTLEQLRRLVENARGTTPPEWEADPPGRRQEPGGPSARRP